MENLMTYSTFKKRYAPQIYSCRDWKGWVNQTIEPTMRNAGFKQMTQYFDDDIKPRELALSLINPDDYELVVYSIWKHQCGYSKCIDIFYKNRSGKTLMEKCVNMTREEEIRFMSECVNGKPRYSDNEIALSLAILQKNKTNGTTRR